MDRIYLGGTGHDICFLISLLREAYPSFSFYVSYLDDLDKNWILKSHVLVLGKNNFDFNLFLKKPLSDYSKDVSIVVKTGFSEFEKCKGESYFSEKASRQNCTLLSLDTFEELEQWEARTNYGRGYYG